MRILWIGKQPSDGEAGDEVFDRRTVAACRARGHDIDLYHPTRVGRAGELANLLSGVPHYRTRFASARNRSDIRRRAGGYDSVICSWEPFDILALGLASPTILVLHNVTSRALPALFPGSALAALGAMRARAWERRWYRRSHFAAIAALSRRDLAYVAALPDSPEVLLLPPGMPPCVPLAPDGSLLAELVISGTYDWVPKRRDILRFAREYGALEGRLPVHANDLPPEAAHLLHPRRLPSVEENSRHLRFGVITDRFEAGHKLKTLAYIAANQIVLSFADVGFDFADIPDHELFIRKLSSPAEIAAHIAAVAAIPTVDLRRRFVAFQNRCARNFSWDQVAATLMRAAGETASRGLEAMTL